VLPFTKRSARDEASELINTGDIEVVRPNAKPSPSADRPRVFARSVSDEDMTTLMPRKGPLAAFLKQQQAAPPRPRTQKPVLMEEPTRAFVRPPAAPAPSIAPVPQAVHATHNAPTAPAVPSLIAKPRVSSSAPPAAPRAQKAEMHPASVPPSIAPVVKHDSDAKIDPPATVITTRTRLIAPRPTVSWAAALVAMGVFVGLVTAVIARGDADSLIDATASFVDPSAAHAAGASLSGVQQKFVAPVPSLPSMSTDAVVASKDEEPKSVALADLPTASPAPQKPAPVAYAAPVWRPARIVRPAPRPAPVAKEPKEKEHEEKVAAAPAPKAAPAAKPHAAPAAKAASEDDVESASAADALAKAQLEASLK